jgi:ferredoxin
VPEELFLRMCISCGECLQACPNDVLQPATLDQGIAGLWTPRVAADWSGCEASCNNCGHVCPTGAIRALPLEEKRVARMGLAVVNQETCLPYAGQGECQLCVDECTTAGYHAIEFVLAGTELDPFGMPIPDSGFLAPVVLADLCVGCGLCQARCFGMNVAADRGRLSESAIVVQAGEGREDRLRYGSYIALRAAEQRQREREQSTYLKDEDAGDSYLPDFLK